MSAKVLNILLIAGITFSIGCSTSRVLPRKQYKPLAEIMENSPAFNDHFTGFVLFDPTSGEMVYQQNADKYFTPASNTKIFTFYTALHVLGDSLPLLHYARLGDSLVFRGAGNPLVLHPDFDSATPAIEFLQKQDGPLFFSPDNFRDEHFGAGWSWADYTYGYQAEKASLPLYGNVVRLKTNPQDGLVRASPGYFQPYLRYEYDEKSPGYRRELTGQTIYLNRVRTRRDPSFEADVPFDYSPSLVVDLLRDTLKKPVKLWTAGDLEDLHWKTLRQPVNDTLYRRLLHPSDNFVAEQVLLMCADELYGELNTDRVIAYARDSLLNDLPDPLEWHDGSGLSRYNLFTPRTIVALLHKIYQELPRERIFDLFPAGGVSGTIRSWYGAETPYVFAKTGTLRNRHCLSGYLLTRSGRVLIFSFMHNNYTGSSNGIKEEMARVLALVREF